MNRIIDSLVTNKVKTENNDEQSEELIIKCQHGDMNAFNLLIRQYQPYAFAIAFRLLCDEQDAKDVVQESFIRIWKNLHRFDHRVKFTTWIYKIATNISLDRLRIKKRHSQIFSVTDIVEISETMTDEQGFDEIYSNAQLAQIIMKLTEDLPTKQRLVFILRDLEDLTVEEVCKISGLTIGSVKTNLHYARRTIRTWLSQQYNVKEI